jgi:hypothetical protein
MTDQSADDEHPDKVLTEFLARITPTEEWYHYTTITGLKGILDKTQLWGTHIAYLNDSREIEYGIEALARLVKMRSQELPEFKDNADGTATFFPMASLWSGTDGSILDRKEVLKHDMGPFVACLSRSRDLLSQWRGYGRGGGYAIRFDPKVLADTIHQVTSDGDPVLNVPKPDIEWVAYVWTNFQTQIVEAVSEYLDEITFLVAEPEMTDDEVAALSDEPQRKFFDKVLYLATRMKHPKFQEEWETRIMCRCDETFYTESQTLGLIPRTSFGFEPRAIQEIIVGPSDYSQARKQSVDRYLSRHRVQYPGVEVTVSEIPYREL